MTTLTQQWLLKRISEMEKASDEIPFGLDEDANNTLEALKIALASMGAEPVADVVAWSHPQHPQVTCNVRLRRFDIAPGPLYTAPPVPVAPPCFMGADHTEDIFEIVDQSGDANEKVNSQVIPEGYALVPIEPTPSMLNAAPQPTVKQHITGIGSAELYAGLAGLGAEKDVNDE